MIKCPTCQNEMSDEADYCNECGSYLRELTLGSSELEIPETALNNTEPDLSISPVSVDFELSSAKSTETLNTDIESQNSNHYYTPVQIPTEQTVKGIGAGKVIGISFAFIIVFALGCLLGYFVPKSGDGELETSYGTVQITAIPTNSADNGQTTTDSDTDPVDVVAAESIRPNGTVEYLAPYRNLTVEAVKPEISDDDLNAEVNSRMSEYSEMIEVTERTIVDWGDMVNMNYTGTIDGELFDGGTDDTEEGTDLEIGSYLFIDGFEEQLVGVLVGDMTLVTVTFPEDYIEAEYAGKEAVFEVMINKISEYKQPELTDGFVSDNFGYATVEEYLDALREELYEDNLSNTESMATYEAFQQVVDNSTFNGILEEDITAFADEEMAYYEYYASYFGTDINSFFEGYLGLTYDEACLEMRTNAENQVKQYLILFAIADAENISLTDEEYEVKVAEYAAMYEYDVEEFRSNYPGAQLMEYILIDMAQQIITDTMVISYTTSP